MLLIFSSFILILYLVISNTIQSLHICYNDCLYSNNHIFTLPFMMYKDKLSICSIFPSDGDCNVIFDMMFLFMGSIPPVSLVPGAKDLEKYIYIFVIKYHKNKINGLNITILDRLLSPYCDVKLQ